MTRATLIVLSAIALFALGAAASVRAEEADGFKLGGSARVRYETLAGQARAGAPASEDAVFFRTVLQAQYRTGPLKLVAGLWDSRAYGSKTSGTLTSSEIDAAELVELYADVDLKNPLGPGSKGTLQLGRFGMDLGSRRLVAAEDYRNTTSGYTGARLDLHTPGGGAATLFYTLPQTREPESIKAALNNRVRVDRETTDLSLWGGLASHPVGKLGTLEMSFINLDERDGHGRPTRDRHLRDLGGRLIRDPHPRTFDYEAEAIWQFGHISASTAPTAATLEVGAYFLHLDAGYQFGGPWKPHLSVEYDLASGDQPGGDYGHFDTLYGMRRVDYAPSGLYKAIGRANISAPGLRLELTPSRRLDGFFTWKSLWLAAAEDAFSNSGVRDAKGQAGRHAGEQFDSRVRYWLVPDSLRFEADALMLYKGRFLKAAPNANKSGDTAFLSLNLTASF